MPVLYCLLPTILANGAGRPDKRRGPIYCLMFCRTYPLRNARKTVLAVSWVFSASLGNDQYKAAGGTGRPAAFIHDYQSACANAISILIDRWLSTLATGISPTIRLRAFFR